MIGVGAGYLSVPTSGQEFHTAELLFNIVTLPSVREAVFNSGGISALVSCAQADGEVAKRLSCQALQVQYSRLLRV